MKMYATVTSERASKGQGGNDFLDIRITVGNAKNPHLLESLTVRPDEKGFGLYDHEDNLLAQVTEEELKKGEKQKGETEKERWENEQEEYRTQLD